MEVTPGGSLGRRGGDRIGAALVSFRVVRLLTRSWHGGRFADTNDARASRMERYWRPMVGFALDKLHSQGRRRRPGAGSVRACGSVGDFFFQEPPTGVPNGTLIVKVGTIVI